MGRCSVLKRGWLFDIGDENPTWFIFGIFLFVRFISQYKDHYKPISISWHVSQGCCMLPLPRCRSNPNEVDLSFCGSQWLLSSQAYCRRDLPWHDKTSSCRKFQLYSPRRQVIASGCIWNPLLHPTWPCIPGNACTNDVFSIIMFIYHLLQRVTHPKWNYPLV